MPDAIYLNPMNLGKVAVASRGDAFQWDNLEAEYNGQQLGMPQLGYTTNLQPLDPRFSSEPILVSFIQKKSDNDFLKFKVATVSGFEWQSLYSRNGDIFRLILNSPIPATPNATIHVVDVDMATFNGLYEYTLPSEQPLLDFTTVETGGIYPFVWFNAAMPIAVTFDSGVAFWNVETYEIRTEAAEYVGYQPDAPDDDFTSLFNSAIMVTDLRDNVDKLVYINLATNDFRIKALGGDTYILNIPELATFFSIVAVSITDYGWLIEALNNDIERVYVHVKYDLSRYVIFGGTDNPRQITSGSFLNYNIGAGIVSFQNVTFGPIAVPRPSAIKLPCTNPCIPLFRHKKRELSR